MDVAIVGGGITGLTCAYLLKQAGLHVAVIEKDTIGNGTTGHTTGKVTSQHNLIYDDLRNHLGENVARTYGIANQTALEEIERVIKTEKIDCGWMRADNFVFTDQDSQIKRFKAEAKVAAKIGLPASFETQTLLPFEVKAAVKFANQAQMNAQAYISGLAKAVEGGGCRIFEKSRVKSFHDGEPSTVGTAKAAVYAKDIIVATNVPTLPLVARGAYCVLEYPHTSYIVAGRTKKEIKGMYISPDDNHHSILPVTSGKERFVLVGGENHIPGLRLSPKARYQKLADYAEEKLGVSEILYRWSARDYLAYDDIPLIGHVYPWSKHLYTATAFRKWGLSSSMVAGMILRDFIVDQHNDWAEIFTPQRWTPITSIPRVVRSHVSS